MRNLDKIITGSPGEKNQVAGWPADGLEYVPICPVCGSRDRRLLYEDLIDRVYCSAAGKWSLYCCASCESGWLDPRPTQDCIGMAYDKYYTHVSEEDISVPSKRILIRQLHAWQSDYKNARYGTPKQNGSFGGRWLVPLLPSLRAKADAQLRHLPQIPSGGGRLLDVGCGNGDFLKVAAEIGWNTEGIDFDPEAVGTARRRGLNVSCASTSALTIEQEKFDVITLSHVIEHVHDPINLLGNLFQLLKPGGMLWLETPNLSSFGAKRFGASWRGLEVPRHLVIFSPKALSVALEKAGFQKVKQHWHGMILFSIYAESTAIVAGYSGRDAIHRLIPPFNAIIDELREMLHPDRREFLTFTALK